MGVPVATRQPAPPQRADPQRSSLQRGSQVDACCEKSSIARLQRSVGNRAIHGLLQPRARPPSRTIQPKLTVSHPEDESEREADRVADQVMRMPAPRSSSTALQTRPVIQRACDAFEEEVQRKPDLREVATKGVAGPATSLPHLDAIQRSFGNHDVSGVEAHTDERATAANQSLDAVGYTIGNHVAFAGTPDLHTAAHEATHVVQQRAGVQLSSGLGQAGDAYERHADAVADRVVNGKQAGPLLDQMAERAGNHHTSAAAAEVMQSADQPVQMQRAPEKTQKEQSTTDPMSNLQNSLHAMLEKQQLMEQVNGPMAHALAKAYINRTGKLVELHATPYIADKVQAGSPKPWSEAEVYTALVGALDVTKMGKAWVPRAGAEVPKGDGVWLEVGKYLISDFIGGTDIKGIAWSQAKDATLKLSVGWLKRKGLVAIAEIATGVGAIVAFFDFVCTTLELLIWIQEHSEERKLSKDEIIVSDVKTWLRETEEEAESAKKAAQEAAEAARRKAQEREFRSKPFKVETTPAVRSTTRIGP